MSIELKAHELRVLGVLIEKSMAQPQYYPMTINAVTVACNQKNNRDPILELTEGEVSAALHELQRWQLVTQAPPDSGARVNRFRHETETRFNWNAPMRAIMAELMIRGPQTVNALRTNASRMTRLEANDYVLEILGELQRCDPPMVLELPRQIGQSATRFAHLLGGPIAADAPPTAAAHQSPPSPVIHAGQSSAAPSTLEKRVSTLESQIEELQRNLAEIRDRLSHT